MPRGGSRKGEKRGAAKDGFRHVTNDVAPAIQRAPPRRKRPVYTPLAIEREDTLRALLAKTNTMPSPKDRMMQAMHRHFQMAEEYNSVRLANEQLAVQNAGNPELSKQFEAAVSAAEERENFYLREGCAVAAQVAPYCHPRLMAAAFQGSPDTGPFAAIKSILDEIAERNRQHPMVIEHNSQETVGDVFK